MSEKTIFKRVGKVLKTYTEPKIFYAKGSNNGTGLMKVTMCSDGLECTTLPKGVYKMVTTIKRRQADDSTYNNMLYTVIKHKGTVFFEYNDPISAMYPSGTTVIVQHDELLNVTADRSLHDFELTVTEMGEHSNTIEAEISVIRIGDYNG